MMRASWNGQVLAECEKPIVLEGNHYFPPASLHKEFLQPISHRTVCSWKGEASYYDVVVDGARNENAAWYYPAPSDAAPQIKDHVAFWKGIEIEE